MTSTMAVLIAHASEIMCRRRSPSLAISKPQRKPLRQVHEKRNGIVFYATEHSTLFKTRDLHPYS